MMRLVSSVLSVLLLGSIFGISPANTIAHGTAKNLSKDAMSTSDSLPSAEGTNVKSATIPLTEGAYTRWWVTSPSGQVDPDRLIVFTGSGVGPTFSFLKFDLTDLDAASYISVVLEMESLMPESPGAESQIDVYAIANSQWSKDTLIWSNHPAFEIWENGYMPPAQDYVGSFIAGDRVVDLTHFFQQSNEQKMLSFALVAKYAGSGAEFLNAATLKVEYKESAASQGVPDTSWYIGNEDAGSYTIYTADELAGLAQLVNDYDIYFKDKTITLGDDIDLSAYGKNWNDGKGWIPIGRHPLWDSARTGWFHGDFDGAGHTIRGLYMDYNSSRALGLFGGLAGTMRNLALADAEIKCLWGVTSGTGMDGVGSIAGFLFEGMIENCYVTGNLDGGSTVVGGIAGIVGEQGVVRNCYSTAAISGFSRIGGLVGQLFFSGAAANNAALNASVEKATSGTGTGRVIGYSAVSGGILNNYAWAGMPITAGGEAKFPLDEGHDNLDGENLSMEDALTAAFWTGTMGWDGDVWVIEDGKLPALMLTVTDESSFGDIPRTGVAGITEAVIAMFALLTASAVLATWGYALRRRSKVGQ